MLKINYTKITKENNELSIYLDGSKNILSEKIGVSLVRNTSLNITKDEKIYIKKIEYNCKNLSFEENNIYEFKDNEKQDIINNINEMLKEHNIKDGKEIIANSYDTLIEYLKM